MNHHLMSDRDPLNPNATFAGKVYPRASVKAETRRLRRELAGDVTPERRAEIDARLALITDMQKGKAYQYQAKPKRSRVPTPKSYIDAMAEKREDAHKSSGFNRIRARFLQGGSPGAGKKK